MVLHVSATFTANPALTLRINEEKASARLWANNVVKRVGLTYNYNENYNDGNVE